MYTHRVSNHSLSCGIFPSADCANGGIIIVDCVLEFLLPRFRMKDTSERELLINKVLRTLQRKCLKLRNVSVREVNEARGSDVRLDDERTPNIPQETVSRVFQLPSSDGVLDGNGSLTLDPTGYQAEEKREPLGQKKTLYCVNGGLIIVDCVLAFLLPRFRMKETSERELLINKVLRTLQRKCLKLWKVSVKEVNEARADCVNGGLIIVDCVLEFLLPRFSMKETSERELLINKVLRTLQRKCLKLWKVSVREVNEARADCVNGGIIIVDSVLEFLLPRFSMKETSERELLINKVLRTLQRKCLMLWKVSVREVNEARGSEVRLDYERTPNIPQETVSRVFQLPSSDDSEWELLINKVLRTLQRKCLKMWKVSVREVNEVRGSEDRLDDERTPNIPQETVSRVFQLLSSDDCANGEIIIVDCVLEFLLPRFRMKETSERELLINKVLRTLQRKCLKLWKVSVREVNEAGGSEVRLDYERTPNIPQETVSRVFHLPSSDGVLEGNGSMTLNPTGNQAEETRDPL
ncbi:hypothetical protein POTOM_044356 [Populus tomentosa]|uniref:Uncharacterized protein n=1 Tax=Populus tomentosa TaxID=118781 RepID=A0A8X8CFE0_POPTO|nr:hypothetical protein POTOM_044356 [Populus tomentosa]